MVYLFWKHLWYCRCCCCLTFLNSVVLQIFQYAIKRKFSSSENREHWMDHALEKYDRTLVEDVKLVLRVLAMYIPIPVFWALFDQQGSRWTFQATRYIAVPEGDPKKTFSMLFSLSPG